MWMSSVVSLLLLFQAAATAPPQPLTLEGAKTFVYRKTPQGDLRLHVFSPSGGTGPFPAVVFFFGGGWTGGKIQQFEPHSRYLASRGMIGIVADYRVRNRHNTTPAESVEDAMAAMAWVREHAGELNIDPSRLAAGGGSAGGHLAAATALLPAPDSQFRPAALVLFNPAVDIAALRPGTEKLSPAQYVRKGVGPTIIFHGDADTTVPYRTVVSFCGKMKDAANRCELVTAPEQKHGFFNTEPWLGKTIQEMDKFLVSIGYLKKAS
jgi:acetyl esterase/lipase